MRFPWRAALAAALLCSVASPRGAQAQIDYRNLDDDRPTHVEDAYPLERFAFELITPYRVVRGRGGQTLHALIPEVEYGLLRNAQIGVKLPVAALDEASSTTRGVSGARLFALYNLNTEGAVLPAVSVRSDVVFPVGSLGGSTTRGSVKVLATRSLGRSRLHLNAEYGFGEGTTALVEGTDRWWYGAALDRTLFRHSTLVVAEVYALRQADGTPVEVNASVGVRYQWTPTIVLDLGVARGLRRNLGPDLEFTFGLSRAFALPWLMPRGRTPTPVPSGGDHDHAR
jgi:hypothetical protein